MNRTGIVFVARIIALSLLLAAPQALEAQDVSFSASVSSTQVPVGEQFQITFTLSGGSLRSHEKFRQPDLNSNFLTLMGPSTSQQMQIINGRVSTSISWTYVLQPRAAGTYSIGPASIVYDGQTLKTNSLTLKVVPGAPGGGAPQPKKGEAADVNLGDNLFIRAIVDKRAVYVGEPVSVTYKLYSRVAFGLGSPIKLPRMVGFWSEDIETPTQLRPQVEMYNGKQYETYTLKKVVYFPTQAGALSIDPFEINCTVQVRQRRKSSGDDVFDRFFSDPMFDSFQNVKKTLLTEKISINAKPLPEDGRPASFNGAVGEYVMDVTSDRTKLTTNDAVTLRVVVRGEGNIKLLEEPMITVPGGIDRYDPKVTEDITRGNGVISGVKTFEYLLVPRYPGSFAMEPVEFSYFNPAKGRYVTLRSRSFTFDVSQGAGAAGTSGPTAVNWQRQDLRPLKQLGGPLAPSIPGRIPLPLMFTMYVLPFAAMTGGLIIRRRYVRVHGDVVTLRMRRATRLAERHLARSRTFLEARDHDAYYLEIARALWGYTQHRLTLPTSETSIDTATQRLRDKGADEHVIASMRDALERIEFARFSPTRSAQEEMRSLYDAAKSAIITTESSLKG